MIANDRDILFDKFLDLFDLLSFFCVREDDCLTRCSSSSCSSDTMDVCFWLCRYIIDDHMREKIDIDTSGCNICRYEDPYLIVFEIFEGVLSCSLRLISMDGCSFDTRFGKYRCYLVGSVLCSRKDECIFNALIFEDVKQKIFFILLFHVVE